MQVAAGVLTSLGWVRNLQGIHGDVLYLALAWQSVSRHAMRTSTVCLTPRNCSSTSVCC